MEHEQEQKQEPQKEVCGVEGCQYPKSGMMPYHKASERCQSGKKAHCTCDTCY